jgi:hypothetical protein
MYGLISDGEKILALGSSSLDDNLDIQYTII